MKIADWEAHRAKMQEIANAKRILFKTHEEWCEHRKNCKDCNYGEKPFMSCPTGQEFYKALAPDEWYDMPMLTCLHCKHEWQEDDYYYTKEEDIIPCPECGMKHEVLAVDTVMQVKIQATGEFDPEYLPEFWED